MNAATISFAIVASLVHAGGWTVVAKSDRCVVMTRDQPGSRVKEIRAQGIVDAPAWVLKNVVDDVPGYTKLIPYTTQASVVGVDGPSRISHQRLEMPFMQAREYVVTIDDAEQVNSAGHRVFTSTWRSASLAHKELIASDALRVDVNDGSWTFEELPGGKTLATFQMAVDPAGSLPAPLVNVAQQAAMPQYLVNLEERAALAKYRVTTPTVR